MKLEFRKTINLTLVIIYFLTSSCTKVMWEGNAPHKYDIIEQFLTTENGEKVVFIGKSYHYIFDDKDKFIRKILGWKNRHKLRLSGNETLSISKTNKVEGIIDIEIRPVAEKLSDEDVKFLEEIGFKSTVNNSLVVMRKKLVLKGEMYIPKPNVTYTSSNLAQKYQIILDYKDGILTRSKKIALTPITVTTDAVLLLSGAVLVTATGLAIAGLYSGYCVLGFLASDDACIKQYKEFRKRRADAK